MSLIFADFFCVYLRHLREILLLFQIEPLPKFHGLKLKPIFIYLCYTNNLC